MIVRAGGMGERRGGPDMAVVDWAVDLEQLLFFIKTPCKLTRLGSIKS